MEKAMEKIIKDILGEALTEKAKTITNQEVMIQFQKKEGASEVATTLRGNAAAIWGGLETLVDTALGALPEEHRRQTLATFIKDIVKDAERRRETR